jgi:large subunit ribosomal protein L24
MEAKKKFKIHVRKDDTVVVITGKDKGKQGKVKKVLPKTGRVVVEGVNMVKKHTKPSAKNMQGGIIEMEAPIHSSNVMSLAKIEAKKDKKNG